MEQLELPLKFKPNTYQSYTDIQKKEYWYANYCIQLQKIDTAVRMLRDLVHQIDLRKDDPEKALSDLYVKGRIRKICNDLEGRRKVKPNDLYK